MVATLTVVWGSSFMFIRVMSDAGMSGFGIAAVRTGLGFLTVLPFVLANRHLLRQPRRTWFALAGLGLFNFAVPWTIFGMAAEHVPSGAAAIVNSTTPLWVTLVSLAAMRDESVGGLKAVGVMLGFAGVVVLMGDDMGGVGGAAVLAMLVILVATLAYACSALFIRKAMAGVPPVVLAGGQVGFAALYLAPLALATGSFSGVDYHAGVIGSAAVLGMVGSGLGPIVYMALIQQFGAIRAAVVTYLMPPVGVLLGWLVLDERVDWNMLAGLALILMGVALTQGLIRGANRPAREPVVVTPAGGE